MPLNLNFDNSKNIVQKGVLYVVATPIGNLEDITIRAIKTLAGVDIIAAEDTRTTSKLLSHFNIPTRLISYHEHNEQNRAQELISRLEQGEAVALVSDAGTPSVSDPGFRLVKASLEKGLPVIPIPGVSAAITAICAAGLPTDSFIFVGFLPRKKGRRLELIKSLSNEKRTMIFYESPKRILKLLGEIAGVLGDRPAVLAREMTKLHEEFIRGNLSEIAEVLELRNSVKGECTLVVTGKEKEQILVDSIIDEIYERLEDPNQRPSSLAKELAAKYSIQKTIVYEEIQKLIK